MLKVKNFFLLLDDMARRIIGQFIGLFKGPTVTRILVQFWVEVITLVPFPVPFVQSVETDDRKQFQHLNIGLNNTKFDNYFWNSIDARTRFSK